jgi:LmbE family N-acetylglucosaminyl deacetylase
MVVAPHPDDAEYGAGGTVARWTSEGRTVVYAVCTSGDKGTGDRTVDPADLAETREREQLAAAEVLGVSKVEFLRHPDQTLEDTPEFRKEIVRLIRTHRPHTVVSADPHRRYLWHRDHRITGRVAMDAVFPYARDHLAYPDLLEEGLEPHKVKEVLFWGPDEVNHRCDITETFERKMAALRCHESQMPQDQDVRRWEDWVRGRCETMAHGDDFDLAEGFHRVEIPW